LCLGEGEGRGDTKYPLARERNSSDEILTTITAFPPPEPETSHQNFFPLRGDIYEGVRVSPLH